MRGELVKGGGGGGVFGVGSNGWAQFSRPLQTPFPPLFKPECIYEPKIKHLFHINFMSSAMLS